MRKCDILYVLLLKADKAEYLSRSFSLSWLYNRYNQETMSN